MQPKPLYHQKLERILESRCQRNAQYSLRAFAKDLGISASRLSGILNGKFGLSRKAASEISINLGLNQDEQNLFCDSVEAHHARSVRQRDFAKKRLEKYKNQFLSFSLDQFQIISDWHHFAIMELMGTGNYSKEDTSKIAKKFLITPFEVEKAIERLIAFDLLKEDSNGFLKTTGSFLVNSGGVPSDAIKKHQSQLLKKAETALHEHALEEREMRSLTIAIDPKLLPELKKQLIHFSSSLSISRFKFFSRARHRKWRRWNRTRSA